MQAPQAFYDARRQCWETCKQEGRTDAALQKYRAEAKRLWELAKAGKLDAPAPVSAPPTEPEPVEVETPKAKAPARKPKAKHKSKLDLTVGDILKAVNRLPKNPLVPILSNLHVDMEGTARYTDMDVYWRMWNPFAKFPAGPYLVGLAALKSLAKCRLADLSLDGDHLTDGTIRIKVGRESLEDYPDVPEECKVEEGKGVFLPISVADVQAVAYAASTDADGRKALTGMFISTGEIACTDGHRLAVRQVPALTDAPSYDGDSSIPGPKLIMPGEMMRLIAGERGLVSHIYCKLGRPGVPGWLRVVLDDGRYEIWQKHLDVGTINYRAVIQDRPHTITVNRQQLADALKRAVDNAGSRRSLAWSPGVCLCVDNAGIRMEYKKQSAGIEFNVPLEGESTTTATGEDFRMGINAAYLLDAIKDQTWDRVSLGVENAQPEKDRRGDMIRRHGPIVIQAGASTCVVMPMMIAEPVTEEPETAENND